MHRGGTLLLRYLKGVKVVPGGSASNLLDGLLAVNPHAANLPSSQQYFYKRPVGGAAGLGDAATKSGEAGVSLRIGLAQMLSSTRNDIRNQNAAHPLFFSQTSPKQAGLCVSLVMALRKLRIGKLTELQGALIPLVLKGKHVIAHAETGTGKSFGIALATVNRILRGNVNYRLHTVILVPTEELAMQYDKWLRYFGGCSSQIVQVAIDSIPLEGQLAKLHNIQPHILVGTPQRIADITRLSPTIIGEKLRRKVDCVVLDEADLVLQQHVQFGRLGITGADLVERIFRSRPEEVPAQMVAISATVDGATAQRLNGWMRNDKAVRLTTSFVEHAIPPTITFYMLATSQVFPPDATLRLVLRLIFKQHSSPRILVFTEPGQVGPVTRLIESFSDMLEVQPHLRDNSTCQLVARLQRTQRSESGSEPSNGPLEGGAKRHTGDANGAAGMPAHVLRPEQLVGGFREVFARDDSAIARLNEGRLLIGVGGHDISRGMHVSGVSHVVIYGSCPSPAQFVHCAGRTGRMGMDGEVILLFPPEAARSVQQVCRAVELPFAPGKVSDVEELLSGDHFFASTDAAEQLRIANVTLAARRQEVSLAEMQRSQGSDGSALNHHPS